MRQAMVFMTFSTAMWLAGGVMLQYLAGADGNAVFTTGLVAFFGYALGRLHEKGDGKQKGQT